MHEQARRSGGWAFAALLSLTAAISAVLIVLVAGSVSPGRASRAISSARVPPEHQVRHQLFEELRPVPLVNCQLERFGETHDGGYLLCGNLLEGARAAYSYGISGYDGWGCDIATRLSATTHQYDCFNLLQPTCTTGKTVFHPLCIAGGPRVDDEGRIFQPLQQQIADNNHTSSRIVVKMDVEGAEWESLLRTPDDVLERIDQLAIELHGVDEPEYVEVVRKLKDTFVVAHVHANNYTCSEEAAPFPSWVYEVLFVNKRIGRVDESAPPPKLPHPLDRPNGPLRPNCTPRW